MTRLTLIGDATIAILAGQGMRGLTHRAVDHEAGLPLGTTSNYARTRAALLELSLARMTELEAQVIHSELAGAAPSGVGELAGVLARIVHRSITTARTPMIARYELALEATRRPELRTAYDAVGLQMRQTAATLLSTFGSSTPERHARTVVSWLEGATFYSLAGTGWRDVPTEDELRAELTRLLFGLLPSQRHTTESVRP
jgi:DNA-binding transcriptional regulator YbjK